MRTPSLITAIGSMARSTAVPLRPRVHVAPNPISLLEFALRADLDKALQALLDVLSQEDPILADAEWEMEEEAREFRVNRGLLWGA